MSCLDDNCNNKYQRNSEPENIVRTSAGRHEDKLLNEDSWLNISNDSRVWWLPIPKQYGGHGLILQECIAALDGFFKNYADIKIIAMFMSRVRSWCHVFCGGAGIVKGEVSNE